MMKNFYEKTALVLVILILSGYVAHAQERSVSGSVEDETGDPLPGASVIVTGTSIGTITDINGNFNLNVPEDQNSITISFVGYQSTQIELGEQTNFDIVLSQESAQLQEVVVVGYGTQQRKDVTGSISSISTEQTIERRPITQIDNALQGLAPGLNVINRNAKPGELTQVTVRAIGSLSAGVEPLWVVDGFPTDQRTAASINPSDIASVEILKDASATAIYGSRGANGVIIITTKSPKAGAGRITVDVSGGVSWVPESALMEVMNAEEYVQYYTEANDGTTPDYISDVWDGQTSTDWQDELYESAAFQKYSLSATGGKEDISYLLSASYIEESGVIPGEGQEKYSARLKLNYQPTKRISIGLNMTPNFTFITQTGRNNDDNTDFGCAHCQAALLPPILPVRRSDGSFSIGSDVAGTFPIGNPLETIQNYKETQDIFRLLGGLSVTIEPIDGLFLKSTLSTNLGNDRNEVIYNAPPGPPRFQLPNVSTLSIGRVQQINWLNENTANYKRQIAEDHSLDVLAGFTVQEDGLKNLSSNVSELQVPGVKVLSIGNTETLTSLNGRTSNSLVSILGRLNYSFMDRYLVTATVRRDGSSRFGANNRWNTFGSFALGWRFPEEAFSQELGFIDNAKLRGSFGTTGSNSIPDFIARPSLNPVNHAFGTTQLTGIAIGDPGNPNLTWEVSEQVDIGLDLTVWDGRFNLIFDYYNNETTSLLLSKNIVPSSGFTGFLTNIGSMRNKGFELSIDANVIETGDFEWNVGGNMNKNDQEILDLGGEESIRNFFGTLRRVVGGELQSIHVVVQSGIKREGEDTPTQPNAQPGDMLFEDANGDGMISNFLGPDGQTTDEGTNVDYEYGINTDIRYKNFRLSALLNGQAGASVLDFNLTQIGSPAFPRVNLSKEFWFDGRYVSESQPGDGITPKAGRFNAFGIGTVSSLGIQKTDFLFLKNITLTYSIPSSLIERYGISNANLYASVENVHMFTDFVGANPEGRRLSGGGPSLFGGSRIPGVSDEREIGLAVTATLLPIPRTLTFGLNFSF